MGSGNTDVSTPQGFNLGIMAAIVAAAAIFHCKSEHSLLLCLVNTLIVNLVLCCHHAEHMRINGRGDVLSGFRLIVLKPHPHLSSCFLEPGFMQLRLPLNSFCSRDNPELLILPPLSLTGWDYRSAAWPCQLLSWVGFYLAF